MEQRCWQLFVDALILRHGGNLTDVLSIACKAALTQVVLPKTTVERCNQHSGMHAIPSSSLYRMEEGGRGRKLHVSVDKGAPPVRIYEEIMRDAPLLITAHRLGAATLIDPTEQEEVSFMLSSPSPSI